MSREDFFGKSFSVSKYFGYGICHGCKQGELDCQGQ